MKDVIVAGILLIIFAIAYWFILNTAGGAELNADVPSGASLLLRVEKNVGEVGAQGLEVSGVDCSCRYLGGGVEYHKFQADSSEVSLRLSSLSEDSVYVDSKLYVLSNPCPAGMACAVELEAGELVGGGVRGEYLDGGKLFVFEGENIPIFILGELFIEDFFLNSGVPAVTVEAFDGLRYALESFNGERWKVRDEDDGSGILMLQDRRLRSEFQYRVVVYPVE
jgi:hypothetical protein